MSTEGIDRSRKGVQKKKTCWHGA